MNKILIIFVVFFWGCSSEQPSTYDQVSSFISEQFEIQNLSEFNYLIVINEQGDCMNCNNTFATKMAVYTTFENILFLICTPGNKVDISHYLANSGGNVLFDYHNKFKELMLIDQCAIIEFGNKIVERIVAINSENLEANLKAFDQKNNPQVHVP